MMAQENASGGLMVTIFNERDRTSLDPTDSWHHWISTLCDQPWNAPMNLACAVGWLRWEQRSQQRMREVAWDRRLLESLNV